MNLLVRGAWSGLHKLGAAVVMAVLLNLPAMASRVEVKMLAQDSALLLIDGRQRMVRAGNTTPEGVKLVSADGRQAVIEVDGKRETLTLSRRIATQFTRAQKAEVRIASSAGGHYLTPGRINGLPVYFMVDTGATGVSMSRTEAERLGIDYRAGQPVMVGTANGDSKKYLVTLDRVAVGDIELRQVMGVVSSNDSPATILLGNSYLSNVDVSIDQGVLLLRAKH